MAKENTVRGVYERHEGMTDLSVIYHFDTITGSNLNLNWHENIEILRFRAGEGKVRIQTEDHDAQTGDFCIFPANHLHGVSSAFTQYDCMIIDRALPLSCGIDTSDYIFPPVVKDGKLDVLYKAVLDAITSPQDEYRVTAVHGALLSLIAYLCRTWGRRQTGGESRLFGGIRQAIRYVREHYAEPITVDDLAAVACFSKYHFSREFKRVTTCSVITYINLVRVEKAKQKLLAGEAVGETALSCGFPNLSYFSKTFRAVTGKTPTAFLRENARNG